MTAAWETVRIGDLGKIVTGKTPSSERPDEFGDAYPFITPSDIDRTSKFAKTERYLSDVGASTLRNALLPPDAVCVVCIGATIGKIVMTDQPSFTNQQINSIIVDRKKFDPSYVFYLCNAIADTFQIFAGGAATPIINKSVFSSIKVRAPKLAIQQKIAAILGTIDDLIANNQRRIALLESMAEEIYREWFVRMRFPGYEVTPKVGGLPVGWTLRALSEVASVNANSIRRGAEPEFIAYLDISAVGTHFFEQPNAMRHQDAPGRARRLVMDGDIIWSSVRPGNKTYCLILNPPENLVASTGFAVISPKPGTPFSYLSKAVTTQEFTDQMVAVAKGAAYPATSFDDFEKAQIVWPSSDLLTTFHQRTEPMLRQVALLRAQCRSLAQQRDVLLPRLISGKLHVDTLNIQYPPSMQQRPAEAAPREAIVS